MKASNTPMQTSNHPYQKNLSVFAELSYCENCGASVGSECDDWSFETFSVNDVSHGMCNLLSLNLIEIIFKLFGLVE